MPYCYYLMNDSTIERRPVEKDGAIFLGRIMQENNPFCRMLLVGGIMMLKKINRNDHCYCGSGKKYKKCCLNKVKTVPTWRTEASKIEIGLHQDKITNTFFVVSDYLKEYPIYGACHLISGILYILLKEQDIECDLCIGEAQAPFGTFDHSWVQINGNVYDIAIQIQLDEVERDPIFAGVDLGTGEFTKIKYGIINGSGLDDIAKLVLRTPFAEYMDGFPGGAWNITTELMRKLNSKETIEVLRRKYKKVERKLIVAN